MIPSFSTAHEYKEEGIAISHPYAIPNRPGTNNGVMYINNIKNFSKLKDELKGVSSSIAETSEIHSMKRDNGVMKMRKIPSIKLPINKVISIKKGNENGYHIMLLNLSKNLTHGDFFDATLFFKHAPPLKVNVEVIKPNSAHKK